MSFASSTIDENVEIVKVLCRSTLTFDALLSSLQAQYPTRGWTTELLTTRLAQGRVQGRIKGVADSPYVSEPQGYTIDQDMVRKNPSLNKIYECFCSNAYPVDIQVPGVGFF